MVGSMQVQGKQGTWHTCQTSWRKKKKKCKRLEDVLDEWKENVQQQDLKIPHMGGGRIDHEWLADSYD